VNCGSPRAYTAAGMMLRPGDRFDRYTIEATLGEGGMGSVYRALDDRLQRRVALKLVRLAEGLDGTRAQQAAARLLREARAAAALSHPNVVPIVSAGPRRGPTISIRRARRAVLPRAAVS